MPYQFEDQVLDPSRRELTRGGQAVAVEPRVFDLLLYLIENRHRLVSKEDLIAHVWRGRIISDSALTSTINAVRRAVGDSGQDQRLVRTSARRGFRFVGSVSEIGSIATFKSSPDPDLPVTRYAQCGEISIAWQAMGRGPIDIVLVPGIISHVEYLHEIPGYTETLRRISSFSRVITFDPRGRGLSDRLIDSRLYEQRLDDVLAVMDAARSSRAVLFGFSSGAATSVSFASAHPDRTSHLVLWGGLARGSFRSPEAMEQYVADLLKGWGTGVFVKNAVSAKQPVSAGEMERFGRLERLSTSPGELKALLHISNTMDVTRFLPDLRMPTLVLSRETDAFVRIERSRILASLIPEATTIEYPEGDHAFWSGDTSAFLRDLAQFVTGHQETSVIEAGDRVLATLLCANVGGPETATRAEASRAYDRLGRQTVYKHHGRLLGNAHGGLLAAFAIPGRAVRCALEFCAAAKELGLLLQVGIHTGEIEAGEPDIDGPVVQTAAQLMRQSHPGEVVVSRVVADLAGGTGLQFVERRPHRFEKRPESQRLYVVELESRPPSMLA